MEEFSIDITETNTEVDLHLATTEDTYTIVAEETAVASNGMPTGGQPGQVLHKASTTNFDAAWGPLPKLLGFALYRDTQHTLVNEFRVEANTWTPLPNNAGAVFDTQLPDGSGPLYDPDTQRLLINQSGDGMAFRIDMTIRPTVSGVRCRIGIDIGGTQGIFAKKSFVLGEAGVAEEHSESITPAFGGNTFLTNGGQVMLYSPHPVDVSDIIYVSALTSNARAL